MHSEPTQAVNEGDYPAVEAYHAVEVRTNWVEAGTELLVSAYDGPDTVKGAHQRARTDCLPKCDANFHSTSTAALLPGSGFQGLL